MNTQNLQTTIGTMGETLLEVLEVINKMRLNADESKDDKRFRFHEEQTSGQAFVRRLAKPLHNPQSDNVHQVQPIYLNRNLTAPHRYLSSDVVKRRDKLDALDAMEERASRIVGRFVTELERHEVAPNKTVIYYAYN